MASKNQLRYKFKIDPLFEKCFLINAFTTTIYIGRSG